MVTVKVLKKAHFHKSFIFICTCVVVRAAFAILDTDAINQAENNADLKN